MASASPVSSRRWVVSIAAIAGSIGRVDNMTVGEALVRLAAMASGTPLLRRLVHLAPGTGEQHGRPERVSPDESLTVWNSMSKRAASRSNRRDDLPASAQSWGLLADDLLRLADAGGFRAELAAELRSRAVAAKPSLGDETKVGSVVPTEPDILLAPKGANARAATPRLLAAVVAPEPASETPTDRDDRRYRELKAMGGDYIYENEKWRATGARGLLTALSKREKAAGRPMGDEKDVRESLKKAATRAKHARTRGLKGNSAFNQ